MRLCHRAGAVRLTQPLDAYLDRIGLSAAPAVSAAGLAAVQRAHRLAIPFENLDIPLGRGIDISPEAVFAKLVTARRGGYCFEQNGLFLRAIREMGFTARPLLARVWLVADSTPPLTHTINLVTIDGEDWIADAGFGGSYSPPLRVIDGARFDAPDGVAHRLVRQGDGWMLERAASNDEANNNAAGRDDWQRQYHFTLATVEGIDLELSNHWTSTRPNTRFTMLKVANLILPDGFASLTDRHFSLYRHGGAESRMVTDADDYAAILQQTLGLGVTQEEADRLFAATAG